MSEDTSIDSMVFGTEDSVNLDSYLTQEPDNGTPIPPKQEHKKKSGKGGASASTKVAPSVPVSSRGKKSVSCTRPEFSSSVYARFRYQRLLYIERTGKDTSVDDFLSYLLSLDGKK